MSQPGARVLVVDDDADIADIVEQVLTAEGYAVTILGDPSTEALRATVAEMRPDCVLLDSDAPGSYGASWANAAWMTARGPAVPVIMFSADVRATAEAAANESARSRAAGFSSVLSKPSTLMSW